MTGQKLRLKYILFIITTALAIAYASTCLFLYSRQRHLIYRPSAEHSLQPDAPDFQLTFEDVQVAIANAPNAPNSSDLFERLKGWWIPAPTANENYVILPNEPSNILKSPKTILYFYGVGRNMGDYNYLARVSAFHQLGFSVFVFDYRGYGLSDGDFPSESQLYADATAAWHYLRDNRQIPPEQIVIYGESMGGAIALDLAIKYPAANSIIIQSSFTSMAEAVKQKKLFKLFPIDLLLHQEFESLAKINTLQMPVLFLHGDQDSVVPFEMSQKLYAAAPEPKQLALIPGADHVRIYQSGEASYLKVIEQFIDQ